MLSLCSLALALSGPDAVIQDVEFQLASVAVPEAIERIKADAQARLSVVDQTAEGQPLVGIAVPTEISGYLDSIVASGTYDSTYVSAISQIGNGIAHSLVPAMPVQEAARASVYSSLGDTYVSYTSVIYASSPDASGQSFLVSDGGGFGQAVSLTLLPFDVTGFDTSDMSSEQQAMWAVVQQEQATTYMYSAVMADGFTHSGLANQFIANGGDVITLMPDSVVGSCAFSPNDVMLMRWLMLENQGMDPTQLFSFLSPAYVPPMPGADAGSDAQAVQEGPSLEQTLLCMEQAAATWRQARSDAMGTFLKHWNQEMVTLKENLNIIQGQYDKHFGPSDQSGQAKHVVPEGFDAEATKASIEAELDKYLDKFMTETGNAADNYWESVEAADLALLQALYTCLDGWPDGSALALQMYEQIQASYLMN